MKRLLWILPLLLLLTTCNQPYRASRAPGDLWYIATAANGGSDTDGDGSLAHPWLTLKHATDTVTGVNFVGDTIMVGAGIFNETAECALGVGVSIYGTGATSILVMTKTQAASSHGCIQLDSYPNEGTDGNQSISNLYIDGDLTGTTAIVVFCRDNVIIHDVTIIDFDQCGVNFRGNAAAGEATIKATGNQIYNCSIINSSTRGAVSDGLIRLYSQSGMLIHDNILDQTGRAQGSNGNIIDAGGGYNAGLKYYNNKSYKPYTEGAEWSFHIEEWNGRGGNEIYNNEFHGGGCHIDLGGNSNIKGNYSYSWWIHDNLFSQDALQPINAGGYYAMGVDLERGVSDAIIERNIFERMNFGVEVTTDMEVGSNNNFIRYNIFREIGTTDNLWAAPILITIVDTGDNIDSLFIDNNTMTASTAFDVGAALITQIGNGTADNIYFRNNISKGFLRPVWISTAAAQVDSVYYYNNLSNNTSDAIYYSAGETITKLISSNNITGDPLFKSTSDFHLQSTSPCRDAGLDVGLTEDFQGAGKYGTAYDIGAFEWGLNRLLMLNDTLTTINYKMMRIDH